MKEGKPKPHGDLCHELILEGEGNLGITTVMLVDLGNKIGSLLGENPYI